MVRCEICMKKNVAAKGLLCPHCYAKFKLQEAVFSLRKSGHTWDQISAITNYSVRQLHRIKNINFE